MKSHIKLGRIAGVELGLHYSWLVIAALITVSLAARFRFTNPGWTTATIWVSAVVTGLLFFIGLFVHELSHALVAKSRGLPIRRITLFLLGGVAQIEREAKDAATEFWMAIAGPIASVALGLLCLGVAHVGFAWEFWQSPQHPVAAILVWLGYINLVLAAFNLIPGFPMDGGRVLRAIVWSATGNEYKATRIATRVGQVTGWLFIVWGMFRVFTGAGLGALWIALIGWFLLQAASATLYQAQANSALHGLTVGDVMQRDCAHVDTGETVQAFVDWYLMRGDGRCFLAYDGGRLAGVVSVRDVRRIDRERWPFTTVREIMRPVESAPRIVPEAPVQEALEQLGREDVDQLMVFGQGNVQGVVTREHVLQLVRDRSELRVA